MRRPRQGRACRAGFVIRALLSSLCVPPADAPACLPGSATCHTASPGPSGFYIPRNSHRRLSLRGSSAPGRSGQWIRGIAIVADALIARPGRGQPGIFDEAGRFGPRSRAVPGPGGLARSLREHFFKVCEAALDRIPGLRGRRAALIPDEPGDPGESGVVSPAQGPVPIGDCPGRSGLLPSPFLLRSVLFQAIC